MNSKIIASVVGVVALVVGAGSYYYMNMNQVQANPDYICSAKIVNPVCNYDVNSCTWSNWVGTCTGTKNVSKTYSSLRIGCDIFSDSVVTSQQQSGEGGGASGLHGDVTYSTESCVVTGVPAPATNTNTNTTAWTGSSNGYVESETASGDTTTTGSGQ